MEICERFKNKKMNNNFIFEDEDVDLSISDDTVINVENLYYNSKSLKESSFEQAILGFKELLQMEIPKGIWGFKALKQLIKCSFKLNDYIETQERFQQLLEYTKEVGITRNYNEKSISRLLDIFSTSDNFQFLNQVYMETLKVAENDKNERLLFKTHLKLANLYLEQNLTQKLLKEIRVLKTFCIKESGEEDLKKGTQLLDIYALEIQAYSISENYAKLNELYNKSLHIKSAIPHPKILAVIRECGGKMHMRQGEWVKAQTDFFESFKNYDEIGNPRKIQCLRYLVVANMLMQSEINPFDSPETQSYKNHPEIQALTNLVTAYQTRDIFKFETILKENKNFIAADAFLLDYIEELLFKIRYQALLHYIELNPSKQISFDKIADALFLSIEDSKRILVSSILSGCIHDAFLDNHQQLLIFQENIEKKTNISVELYEALNGISSKLFNTAKRVADYVI